MKPEKLLDVPLDDIKVGPRYRKDLGDLSSLKESIGRHGGLLQPVGLTPDLSLIWGLRRLSAYREMGRETIPARVISLASLVQAESDENDDDIRKPFTNSEKLAIAKAIKAELGDRRGQRTDLTSSQLGQSSDAPKKGERTDDVAAKAAGFSGKTELHRAEVVEEKCCQDIKDAVDDGTVSLSDAAAIAEEPRDVQEAAIQKVLYHEAPTLNAAVQMVRDEWEDAGVEDEPVLDLLGNAIPDHLMMIAEDNLLFQEIYEGTKSIRRQLDALDKRPSASHRLVGKLQAHCQAIEQAMLVERFGFSCPACGGSGGACRCCLGRRWFVAGDKEKVPKIRRAS